MKVIFSAKADQDLADLLKYINDNLRNGIAAHNIVEKILCLSQKLSASPEIGTSLKTVGSGLEGYRYLIVDNYLLIYTVVDEEVFVMRILYAKSDYVQLLWG